MASRPLFDAIKKHTKGEKVVVYKSSLRGTFIDWEDCMTEYMEEELHFQRDNNNQPIPKS